EDAQLVRWLAAVWQPLPRRRRQVRNMVPIAMGTAHSLRIGSRSTRLLDPLPLDDCPFGAGFRGELLGTFPLGLLVPADRQGIALEDVDGVVGLPFVGAVVVGDVDGLRLLRGIELEGP